MEIIDSLAFEDQYRSCFGDINRRTLADVKEKIRIELGGSLEVDGRYDIAVTRAGEVLQFCFGQTSVWVRIILWESNSLEQLLKAGLSIQGADLSFDGIEDGEKVLYLYYKKFDNSLLKPVYLAIIHFEIGKNPTADISCYFLNFLTRVIVYIYDDRGVHIVAQDKMIADEIENKFKPWIYR